MLVAGRNATAVVSRGSVKLTGVIRWVSVTLAAASYWAVVDDLLSQQQCFLLLNVLLLAYLGFEIRRVSRRQKALYLVNPTVLASFLTFALAFGASNIALYSLPSHVLSTVGMPPEATRSMNLVMLLVVLGALSMWLGYRSAVAKRVAGMLARIRFLRRVLRRQFHMRNSFLALCVVLSLLSRFLMMKLGVYGYSSSYDQLYALAAYREYLNVGDSLGKLALLGAALQYYSPEARKPYSRWLLLFLVSVEAFFGFLSGFKSEVVMPFVVVGLCAYFQGRHLPRWLLPSLIVGTVVAYLIIEPFRVARNVSGGFQNTNPAYIVSTMLDSVTKAATGIPGAPPIWLSILSRVNMTYIASRGMQFVQRGPLPPDAPHFLSNILLSPFLAVIPRLLWETKPLQNDGLWYSHDVLGYNFLSASAMSPFMYLYFAGGAVAVFMGFFAVGVLQRVWWERFSRVGSGGAVVFFGMLIWLVNIDSSFDITFIELVRMFPLLLVAQYGLFKR